ncbi:hypothetical protein [Acinetobacter nectaris]|uniref:hypothetical protein n=1 Tax=Acinetobacter nectaris TaxID=1219382 RepID=UPI001F30AA9A|nr:hypothetical protein [Acinetobacter nectaris]MCF9000248.1 hypothetical protein [Acinetobacter nectaris]MCF9028543.1 hypothetical protein [Acinetobacter nectaris]
MKNFIIGILAVILLVGCVTVVPYNKKALDLHVGMNKQDVLNLLGTPKKVAARTTPNGFEEKYSYWGLARIGLVDMDNELLSQDRLYVTLLDGKVIEWGDKYDPTTMMDKSMENTQKNIENMKEMYQNQNKK